MAMAVVDKRETGNKSPNMEKQGLIRCLEELHQLGVELEEMTTDAHPQVTAYLKGIEIIYLTDLPPKWQWD